MTVPSGPALLVSIDTEGDNQWDVASRTNQTFANIHALEHLHDFFARHDVRPTYLITYPVARDPISTRVLRRIVGRGDAEIGAHHHAWETPPFDPEDVRTHPYALSLPRDRFDAQLSSLTDAISEAVGHAPISYRSGRFGFSADHVSSLERHNYRIESSVAPLFYEAHKGGPDFVGAPLHPYFLAYDSATRPGTSDLLELPVSSALDRRIPAWAERLYGRAPWPYTTKRILRLAKIAQVRTLRPSWSSLDDMNALARQLVKARVPLLNLLFHSSEAIAGGSPYNRTTAELDAFFDRLGRFFSYATKDLGAVPMTFAEFRTSYLGNATRVAGIASTAS